MPITDAVPVSDAVVEASHRYFVDATEADQGVTTSTGDRTLKDHIDAIGTSKKATLYFLHDFDADETTYTLDTGVTIPSNLKPEFENGAIIDGAGTLTINGLIKAGRHQIFGSSLTVEGSASSLQRVVFPEWWGIDGTNDEVQFSAAADYLGTIQNSSVWSAGIVDLDAKPYICNAAINVTDSNVIFQGKGTSTVIRRTNGGSYNTFYFAPTNTVSSQIYEVGVKDLMIICTDIAPTGGGLIRLKSVHGYRIENVSLQDGWNNLQIIGSINGIITNLDSYYSDLLGSETGGTWHIYIDEGDHAIAPTVAETFFNNFELNSSTDRYVNVGMVIKSADGIWFSNGHIHQPYAHCVYIDPATNQHLTGLYFNHVFFDSPGKTDHTGDGVVFASTSTAAYQGFNFNDCIFSGGDGTRGNRGLILGTVTPKEISITNCVILGWYSHGIQVSAAATEFTIQGNRIYSNNDGDIGASGIHIVDSASDFVIQNNQVGRTTDSPAQVYGIYCGSPAGAGVADVIASGNLCKGNTNNEVYVKGTTNVQVRGNEDGSEGSSVASATTITLPTNGKFFNITGTTTITSVTASWVGRTVTLKFAAALTFTDGSNLKIEGDFVTTADDTITITCDGTDWYEAGRGAN